jgi:uncharacterized protein YbjT (DUF2867 family)
MNSKTAIILGASGLTGNLLLQKLLLDDDFICVKLFVRKPIQIEHPKVLQYCVDLLRLEDYSNDFIGDVVFCCIGTTKKKTPDKNKYQAIDFGIPVQAAKLCKTNNISCFIVISALGANANSSIFYNQTKGMMQEAVIKENIKNTYILQPSLILGRRAQFRLGEKVGEILLLFFQLFLFGKLKKYRPIDAAIIADAMLLLFKQDYPTSIIPSDEIIRLVQTKK